MYPRHLTQLINELLGQFRIVYLTGPRQAGKTTIVRAIAGAREMTYISLDEQAALASARQDPHGFIQSFDETNVALDEFQYAPELISAIKAASDALVQNQRGKFLLTGSADIFRSAKVQEALPGHMARVELLPLSLAEKTGQARNLIDYLVSGDFKTQTPVLMKREQIAQWIIDGGYPEAQSKSARGLQFWYNSYIEGRLYKDFESLYTARSDYHSRIQALMPYLAGLCGNLLKYANVANDLNLDDKSVKTYIEILELMFIVQRLPAWVKNRAKRLATGMPKLHFIDTGLASFLLGLRTPKQMLSSQFCGGLLENFLLMELRKHSAWSEADVSFFHFRDKKKNEVDIVMEQSDGAVIGIEVKLSASIKAADFKGLIKLAEFSEKHFRFGVIFYAGDKMLPFARGSTLLYALPLSLLT